MAKLATEPASVVLPGERTWPHRVSCSLPQQLRCSTLHVLGMLKPVRARAGRWCVTSKRESALGRLKGLERQRAGAPILR